VIGEDEDEAEPLEVLEVDVEALGVVVAAAERVSV
jgi:hypothetical protein